MGIIHEERTCNEIWVENKLTVDECADDAEREPDRNVSLEVDSMESFTPEELITFGSWLIQQGIRIQKFYDEKGRPIHKSKGNSTINNHK